MYVNDKKGGFQKSVKFGFCLEQDVIVDGMFYR